MPDRREGRGNHRVLIVVCLLGVAAVARFTSGQGIPTAPRFKLQPVFDLIVLDDYLDEPGGLENPGLQAIALADVDDDGVVDLVAINQTEEGVQVLLGDGDGGFDFDNIYDIDAVPTSVAVADVGSPFDSDFRGEPDGVLDIIVGSDTGEVFILPGLEDGEFQEEFEPDLSDVLDASQVQGLAVGNFDGNGDPDLAVLDFFDEVYVLCNSEGDFIACGGEDGGPIDTGGDAPVDIVAGDFDGDGDTDLAVLNRISRDVSVMFGNGDGTFGEVDEPVVATALDDQDPQDFAVGRIDGDNLHDLVIVNREDFDQLGVVTLYGQRSRRFESRSSIVPLESTAVTLADFDDDAADSLDALVVTNRVQDSPGMLVNDGAGNLLNPVASSAAFGASVAVAAADIGHDALTDAIALALDGARLQVALNFSRDPTETPTPSTPSPTTTGSQLPTSTPTPTVPTGTPTPTNTPTPIPTANYGRCDLQVTGTLAGIATGQLDGDGSPDIAVSDSANNQVHVIFNTASLLASMRNCAMVMKVDPLPVDFISVAVGSAPGAIVAVDVDRDGDLDLAVAGGDGITILEGNGSGQFSARPPLPVGVKPVAITADNYPVDPLDARARTPLNLNSGPNGDAFTDLVVANAGSDFLSILYGRADGGFDVTTRTIPGRASTIVAADFNKDGKVDLAASRGSDLLLLLQEGELDESGRAVFQVRPAFGSGDTIVALASGFFDGNRLPDLLVTRGTPADKAEIFLFQDPSFSKADDFGVSDGPSAAGVGFFNSRDATFDAVVASRDKSVLNFALGDGAGGFPPPELDTFAVGSGPAALSVVDIDQDGMQDVVTANEDGTTSVLLSSVPPPTPTPLPTGTPTTTGTPTATGTQTDTPSVTPTHTGTRTPRPDDTATATKTKEGIFALSGNGCSLGTTAGNPPVEWPAFLLILALARYLRPRRWPRRGGGTGNDVRRPQS